MAVYFTSDTHFNHDKDFVWKARGFESIQEMNEAILTYWNQIVKPQDIVYHLGDLMLGDNEVGLNYIKNLNGSIHIILGNHDTATRQKLYAELPNVVDIKYADLIKLNGYHLYLSHFPTITSNLEKETLKQCTCNLFGHTHQVTNFYNDMPMIYHVGVDSHNCCPVLGEQIIEDMKQKMKH